MSTKNVSTRLHLTTRSSSDYCEACGLSDDLPDAEKGMSTVQRVVARSASLERSAIAASTFANIQYFRVSPHAWVLWNLMLIGVRMSLQCS